MLSRLLDGWCPSSWLAAACRISVFGMLRICREALAQKADWVERAAHGRTRWFVHPARLSAGEGRQWSPLARHGLKRLLYTVEQQAERIRAQELALDAGQVPARYTPPAGPSSC